MLFYLCYKSRKREDINDNDLIDILNIAQERNRSLGITGMLIYLDSRFVQVIEGSKDVVLNLYDSIIKDKRHYEVMKISEGPLKERNFPNWSMGFRALTEHDIAEFQKMNKIENLTVEDILESGSHITIELLKDFYKHSEIDFYRFW